MNTSLAASLADEIISSPKKLLSALSPIDEDKEHMKYICKAIYAIVQTLHKEEELQRHHFSSFAEKCVPTVLTEMLNKQALTSVLYKCIVDNFIPLKGFLYETLNQQVTEVNMDLFNCFTLEPVEYGYRCNSTGNIVFTLEEALQWFLTRGLKAPDGTVVTSLQKIRKQGSTVSFPSVPSNLVAIIQPDVHAFLLADIFYCKPSLGLQNALDYRYEFFQDWEDAEDNLPTRWDMIEELEIFSCSWKVHIPSLAMMKSIYEQQLALC